MPSQGRNREPGANRHGLFASPVGLPFPARPVGAIFSAGVPRLGSLAPLFFDVDGVWMDHFPRWQGGKREKTKYKMTVFSDGDRWRAALLLLLLLTYVRMFYCKIT